MLHLLKYISILYKQSKFIKNHTHLLNILSIANILQEKVNICIRLSNKVNYEFFFGKLMYIDRKEATT